MHLLSRIVPPKARHLWARLVLSFSGRQRLMVFLVLGFLWVFPVCFPGPLARIDFFLIDLAEWTLSFVRAPSPELLVVTIDEQSLKSLNEPWPLPRSRQAQLLQIIGAGKPRLILCDILFQHPETNRSDNGDATLASTIRNLGNVGLISLLEPSETQQGLQILQFSSLQEIRKAALFSGFVWAWFDADEKIRSFVALEGRTAQKSVSVEAAQRLNPGIRLPGYGSDRLARSLVAFPYAGGSIPIIPAGEVLEGKIASATFQNRLVLLGVSAEKQGDFHATPLGEIAGTLLLAFSIDTLLQDRVVEPASHWLWWLLMAVFGGIAGSWCFLREGFSSWRGSCGGLLICTGMLLFQTLFSHFLPPLGPLVFSWMATSLLIWAFTTFFDILEAQNTQHETVVVEELQKRFFPEGLWAGTGYECYGICLPCEKAGGDYYDHFEWPDKSLFFTICDVSGHGFAAGLVTSMAKAMITQFRQENLQDLEEMGDALNATLLTSLQKAKMMTGILGRFNPVDGKVQMKFGGHLPAFHVKPDGQVIEVGLPGFPFGAMRKKANVKQKFAEATLEKGDMLVFYTDGVIEALDWEDKQYTMDRWMEFLKTACSYPTIGDFFESTLKDVNRHIQGRPYQDDVSLLVIRRLADPA